MTTADTHRTHRTHRPSGRGLRAALAAVAGCLVAAGASSAGAAISSTDTRSIVVRYADLDINTRQGASALYRRIAVAAQQVCPDADIGDLHRISQVRVCRQQAVARAVQAIGSPLLAALDAENPKHG
jgi:UrcA family protein